MNKTDKAAETGEGHAPRVPTFDECCSHPAIKQLFAQRDELISVVRAVRCKLYSEKELFDMACEVLDNWDVCT